MEVSLIICLQIPCLPLVGLLVIVYVPCIVCNYHAYCVVLFGCLECVHSSSMSK